MRRFNHFRLRSATGTGASTTSAISSTTGAQQQVRQRRRQGPQSPSAALVFFLFALLFNLYILRTYNWIAIQTLPEASSGDAHATVNGIATGLDNARHDSDDDADHSRAVTRRAARTTRHATVVTVIRMFSSCCSGAVCATTGSGTFTILCVELALPEQLVRQRQFLQHRCDYRFFGYALLVTHFLID